jgi:putative DNA methylase
MSKKAIELNFPFEALSEIAEIESWRKELFRPIYYMHKWWARRLGSVLRAVILAASLEAETDIMAAFYKRISLGDVVIFDPFMGSGTAIGEAHKLGCAVIGQDINPVAYRLVKTALAKLSRPRLIELYNLLQAQVKDELTQLYECALEGGRKGQVLYYFWVKVLPCPLCNQRVDLFSTYLFSQHAYPHRYPQVYIVCPGCDEIFPAIYQATAVTCPNCACQFNPHDGSAKQIKAHCRHCQHAFPIAKTALAQGAAPAHRMYAKLVLHENGRKEYLRITSNDLRQYQAIEQRLQQSSLPLPHVKIAEGYNTKQILNYGYQYWAEMFNARQLFALATLANGIKNLPACPERDALILLFSGALEFNNMFASYKGEGTGAVRHLFSHHILKPERMPIEANVWGTAKSSGSFSTLFRTRLLRAIEYKNAPFEISVINNGNKKGSKKVFGLNPPIGAMILDAYPANGLKHGSIYLACGDAAQTDIPAKSVDAVITDPPFFDNVHYSELADFFYVWQELYFNNALDHNQLTTRHAGEIQDTDAQAFAQKLANVFRECYRVLKDEGLLIFSYHHSRHEGWLSVAQAVLNSGFSFVQAHPVKAEMSVATPKSQAKAPIDIDIYLVCRKKICDPRKPLNPDLALWQAYQTASSNIKRFNKLGRKLSANDVKVILYSQILVELSAGREAGPFLDDFNDLSQSSEEKIKTLLEIQNDL